jgi:hypothetical protein
VLLLQLEEAFPAKYAGPDQAGPDAGAGRGPPGMIGDGPRQGARPYFPLRERA